MGVQWPYAYAAALFFGAKTKVMPAYISSAFNTALS